MNLFRVTRTNPGGTDPRTTLFTDRRLALDEHEYYMHHTSFSSSITAFYTQADPSLIQHFLSE
jgi:hypothetical protein